MKKTIIISALFMTSVVMAEAQLLKIPGEVKVGMPNVLKPSERGTYKLSDIEREIRPENKWASVGTAKKGTKYWEVFSDRDNNTLYAEPSKESNKIGKLDFKEPVIIAEIKNNMALVYTDINKKDFPEITRHAIEKGWVPMDNLVLWDRCPTDDYGVQRKALIAINIENIRGNKKFEQYYYHSPIDRKSGQEITMDMNFYYIMKEINGQALLCRNPTIDAGGLNLMGWVDNSCYTNWNQRACLEANWFESYVNHNRGKKVWVTKDAQGSDNRIFWTYGKKNNAYKDTKDIYRFDPNFLRFPILDKVGDGNKRIHITAFADPDGNMQEFDGNAAREVDERRNEKREANIIFVVEATPDMGKYLEAVKSSLSFFNDFTARKLKVRIGLVLYRNNPDDIEKTNLVEPTDPRLLAMLSANKASGKWTGTKRTVSLRKALETAMNPTVMNFSKYNSNLIVIVGNRGDEKDMNLNDDDMIRSLEANNIQLMSIQVVNSAEGQPGVYYDQIQYMIKDNINKQYYQLKQQNADVQPFTNSEGYLMRTKNKKANFLFACMVYPDLNSTFSEKDVTKYIKNGAKWFAESVDNWSSFFEEGLGNIDGNNPNPEYDAFLNKYLGPDLYRRIKRVKKLFHAYDGYVTLKDLEGEPYWNYIIYMSENELYQLLQELKPLYEISREISNERGPYRDAIVALAKSMIGQSDDKAIKKMTIQELKSLLYGLNVQTENTEYDIEKLTDPKQVQFSEYSEILKRFSEKYKELQTIRNSEYEFRAKFGPNYYYWIPIDKLP